MGWIVGARSISSHVGTAEESEGITLLEAMKWAISKNLKKVIFEGDCQAVTKYLTGCQVIIGWKTRNTLDEVISLASALDNIVYVYVNRCANKAADLLAKKARIRNVDNTWYDQTPAYIFECLNNDLNSVTGVVA
ncbi:hypothetical protein BVC80_7843g2 [Macleaya cordata]|uniref:RNase H type-1 domain-containing protein n=1 Tax=Macleaya cordata TaxID=56857 RepID=A0A200PYQ8_MACCD|nr:hypothetical protein BVC80_7843g2 [Macleaya cordata]